jgi:septal ring factor EnvC (AmiA/AmiB activator)
MRGLHHHGFPKLL